MHFFTNLTRHLILDCWRPVLPQGWLDVCVYKSWVSYRATQWSPLLQTNIYTRRFGTNLWVIFSQIATETKICENFLHEINLLWGIHVYEYAFTCKTFCQLYCHCIIRACKKKQRHDYKGIKNPVLLIWENRISCGFATETIIVCVWPIHHPYAYQVFACVRYHSTMRQGTTNSYFIPCDPTGSIKL